MLTRITKTLEYGGSVIPTTYRKISAMTKWSGKHTRSFEALIGASFDYANKVMTDKRYNESDRLRIAGIVINKAMPNKNETDIKMQADIKLDLAKMRTEANKLLKDHLSANE